MAWMLATPVQASTISHTIAYDLNDLTDAWQSGGKYWMGWDSPLGVTPFTVHAGDTLTTTVNFLGGQSITLNNGNTTWGNGLEFLTIAWQDSSASSPANNSHYTNTLQLTLFTTGGNITFGGSSSQGILAQQSQQNLTAGSLQFTGFSMTTSVVSTPTPALSYNEFLLWSVVSGKTDLTIPQTTTRWNSSNSGSWSTTANWNNSAPGGITDATVGNGGTAQINGTSGVANNVFIGSGGKSGTVSITGGGSLALGGNLTIGDSGNGTVVVDDGSSLVVNSGNGTITIAKGSGKSGTLRIGDATAAGSVSAASIVGGGGNALVLFNHNSASFVFATPMSGNLAVSQIGSGKTILTGNNTYTGGTVIANGDLQIGNGGTTGSIAGNIVDNSHLIFNRSDNLVFAGIISGSGDVTKLGAGILTFTNINTYTGATFVNAGTLAIDGSVSGAGGLVTVASGATLGGSGTLNRDVNVSSGGTLSSALQITGQVTLSNQASVGSVSSGTTTAAGGQQLNVTSATGGTVDTTAGTAQIGTLDGATLDSGNWGATVTNLTSGTVNTSGGALVARQGDFTGTVTGSGGLTKTGSGTLTLNAENTYTGSTIVNAGTLEVAVGNATGPAPIRLVNNGKFRAMANVAISGNIISEDVATTYEKVFASSENLENFGSFSSSIGGRDTTAIFAAGSAGAGTTVTSQFGSIQPGARLTSDRLTINGLDGTTFLLVMNSDIDIPVNATLEDFYLGWFDTGDSTWKNAVLGNHGTAGSLALAGGYMESYQQFLSSNGGWDATSMLGAYGVDTTNNQVWAVIDHNSEFGAVPEPSTYALLALGGATLFFTMRRRKPTNLTRTARRSVPTPVGRFRRKRRLHPSTFRISSNQNHEKQTPAHRTLWIPAPQPTGPR